MYNIQTRYLICQNTKLSRHIAFSEYLSDLLDRENCYEKILHLTSAADRYLYLKIILPLLQNNKYIHN